MVIVIQLPYDLPCPSVGGFVIHGRSVCWLVGRYVCHNSLERREVTLDILRSEQQITLPASTIFTYASRLDTSGRMDWNLRVTPSEEKWLRRLLQLQSGTRRLHKRKPKVQSRRQKYLSSHRPVLKRNQKILKKHLTLTRALESEAIFRLASIL